MPLKRDAAKAKCGVGGARTHIPIFMCLCSMNTWMVSETTRPPRIRAHRQTPVLWLRSLVNLFTVLICRTFWQFQVITVNLLVIERVFANLHILLCARIWRMWIYFYLAKQCVFSIALTLIAAIKRTIKLKSSHLSEIALWFKVTIGYLRIDFIFNYCAHKWLFLCLFARYELEP